MPDLVLALLLDKTGVTYVHMQYYLLFTELVEGWLLTMVGDASSHKALVEV